MGGRYIGRLPDSPIPNMTPFAESIAVCGDTAKKTFASAHTY